MNKEGIMEDNRKGTWGDVTEECKLTWHRYPLGAYAEVRHDNRSIAFLGPKLRISENRDYRVVNEDGTSDDHTGYMRVEHFIPDPEPEWVDVTEECTVRTYNFGASGSWFALEHEGNSVAHLGAETKILARFNYRTTLDDFGKGSPTHAGHIKVEKRND